MKSDVLISSTRSDPTRSSAGSSDLSRISLQAIGSFATTAARPPHRSRNQYTSLTYRTAIMNAFRVARAARPAFNALRTVQRRGYADVAADKIQLSLALPHQVRSRMLEGRKDLLE
jgi:hypothetical protein